MYLISNSALIWIIALIIKSAIKATFNKCEVKNKIKDLKRYRYSFEYDYIEIYTNLQNKRILIGFDNFSKVTLNIWKLLILFIKPMNFLAIPWYSIRNDPFSTYLPIFYHFLIGIGKVFITEVIFINTNWIDVVPIRIGGLYFTSVYLSGTVATYHRMPLVPCFLFRSTNLSFWLNPITTSSTASNNYQVKVKMRYDQETLAFYHGMVFTLMGTDCIVQYLMKTTNKCSRAIVPKNLPQFISMFSSLSSSRLSLSSSIFLSLSSSNFKKVEKIFLFLPISTLKYKNLQR